MNSRIAPNKKEKIGTALNRRKYAENIRQSKKWKTIHCSWRRDSSLLHIIVASNAHPHYIKSCRLRLGTKRTKRKYIEVEITSRRMSAVLFYFGSFDRCSALTFNHFRAAQWIHVLCNVYMYNTSEYELTGSPHDKWPRWKNNACVSSNLHWTDYTILKPVHVFYCAFCWLHRCVYGI